MPCCHSPQGYPINSPICVQNLMSFRKIAGVILHMYPSIYREHRPPATISLAWSVPPQGRHPWNSWPKGFVSSFRNPKGWMDRKMRQMFWAIQDSWTIWIYLAWRQCQANEASVFKSKWLWVRSSSCVMRAPQTTPKLLSPWYTSIASRFLPPILLKFDSRKFSHRWFCHPLNVGLTFLDPAK